MLIIVLHVCTRCGIPTSRSTIRYAGLIRRRTGIVRLAGWSCIIKNKEWCEARDDMVIWWTGNAQSYPPWYSDHTGIAHKIVLVPFDIEIRCVSVEPQFLKPYLVVEPTYLNFLVAKNKININTMIDSFYCTVHTIVADFTTVASKSCFWKDEDHRKKKEEKESIVNELKLYSITGITGITMPQQ